MYYYTAFGLRIASEFEFPELLEIDQPAQTDVNIKVGITPKILEGGMLCSPELWVTPTQCLQHIEEVAYYYAEMGNTIIVEPHPNADQKSIRIYLLCSTMAAIIHQRGCIPLHASGILTSNGVALIIGDTGAGKSTTINALSKKGYQIFTDDVCVLNNVKGMVVGIPSYPVMKLWENSFELLQLGKTKAANKLWPDIEKYGVYFHEQFICTWEPVTKIFVLEKSDATLNTIYEQQKGVAAFVALGSNTYRGSYVEPMQLNNLHFTIVNDLIKQSEVYKIIRPSEGDSLSNVIEIIEKEIQQIA